MVLIDIVSISPAVLLAFHQRTDLDPLPTHSTRTTVVEDSDGIGGEGTIQRELFITHLHSHNKISHSHPKQSLHAVPYVSQGGPSDSSLSHYSLSLTLPTISHQIDPKWIEALPEMEHNEPDPV